jgi:serine/threonine protein phosphatase PrpC
MAKFLYGKRPSSDVIDEEEIKSAKNKNTKAIKKIESLCKKGYSGPGVKKTNQDNFFIYNNFNNNSNNIYMGVCDGHGMFGQDVSGYLVNTLPQNMNNILLNSNITSLSTESTIKLFPIILNTFVSTNIDMTEDDRVDSTFSGSTCVSLFYTPEKLICANVGDSRCVLGKFDGTNWKSKNLSRDQKPSEQDEYIRIINSGGRIESFKDENGNYIGPERVWLKDEDVPGLAMSRSFGDEVAHTVGVITEPEINEYFFLEEDKFIIIASDGLWEFISSDECVGMVKDFYLKNDIDGALNYLYKESSKRWIMEEEVIDDITILMAFLN